MRRPIPSIDRAAWLLIRKYGDESAIEAYRRSECCRCHGDALSATEWKAVLLKVIELHFKPSCGPSH